MLDRWFWDEMRWVLWLYRLCCGGWVLFWVCFGVWWGVCGFVICALWLFCWGGVCVVWFVGFVWVVCWWFCLRLGCLFVVIWIWVGCLLFCFGLSYGAFWVVYRFVCWCVGGFRCLAWVYGVGMFLFCDGLGGSFGFVIWLFRVCGFWLLFVWLVCHEHLKVSIVYYKGLFVLGVAVLGLGVLLLFVDLVFVSWWVLPMVDG